MGLVRSAFLAGSQSRWLRERAVKYRFVKRAVARFMPGEDLDAALAAAGALRAQGIGSVLTCLGENLERPEEAEQVTRNVTNYTYIDNRVINGGVRIETINRAVGRTIPRYRVADADPREVARGGKVRGNEFLVARPDPSRGRGRGRDLPPGHDPEHFQRGYRQVGRQPDPAPVVTPPDPSQGQPANGQPGVTQPGQNPPPPVNAPRPPPARGRGNGFLDRMMRNQATRHAPQGGPPPQQAPSQPGNSGQPSNPGTPQGGPQQGNPPPGNGQGANSAPGNPVPPANSGPPSSQGQGQSANSNGRGHRGAPQRAPKPKQEAPKPDKPEQEKPKDNKGGSGN